MISIARLNARGANANGDAVVVYLLATEYYFDKDGAKQDTMRWGGKLASELGLEGKAVEKEDMLALAGAHLDFAKIVTGTARLAVRDGHSAGADPGAITRVRVPL